MSIYDRKISKDGSVIMVDAFSGREADSFSSMEIQKIPKLLKQEKAPLISPRWPGFAEQVLGADFN